LKIIKNFPIFPSMVISIRMIFEFVSSKIVLKIPHYLGLRSKFL